MSSTAPITNSQEQTDDSIYIFLWSVVSVLVTPIIVAALLRFFLLSAPAVKPSSSPPSPRSSSSLPSTPTLTFSSSKAAILSYLNLLSAGIFVGVVFFHILPESGLDFEDNPRLPFLGVLLGFCGMLWIDQIIILDENDEHNHDHGHDHAFDFGNTDNLFSRTEEIELPEVKHNDDDKHSDDAEEASNHRHNPLTSLTLPSSSQNLEEDDQPRSEQGVKRKQVPLLLSIYLSLGLHSFLAGVAVGQQQFNDSFAPVIFFFCVHKSMDSVAVCAKLFKSGVNVRWFWGLLCLFASITPSGMITSYFLSRSSFFADYGGYLETFSGGILLYVGLIDILVDELQSTTIESFEAASLSEQTASAIATSTPPPPPSFCSRIGTCFSRVFAFFFSSSAVKRAKKLKLLTFFLSTVSVFWIEISSDQEEDQPPS